MLLSSKTRRVSALLGAPLLLLPLLLTACGGGGGGGGGGTPPPTQPPPPSSQLSYTSEASATGNSLSFVGGTSGNELTLTLRATSVDNVLGVAFDLVYPEAQLDFQSASELTAFAGGNDTSFEVFQQPGRLVVGLTRLSPAGGYGGSGDWATFTFTAGSPGSGEIRFENRDAVQPSGQSIALIDWIGGTVTVN